MCVKPLPTSRMARLRKRHSFSSGDATSKPDTANPSANANNLSSPNFLASQEWVHDSECRSCSQCERSFTVMNRRHHCRRCGHIFCSKCSGKRALLHKSDATNGPPRRHRVCDKCAEALQSSTSVIDAVDDETRADSSLTAFVNCDIPFESPKEELEIRFMVISMACFASSFWFLLDEVTFSNPAIWILMAGFLKNLQELAKQVWRRQQRQIQVTTSDTVIVDKEGRKSTTSSSSGEEPPSPRAEKEVELSEKQTSDILGNAETALETLTTLASTNDGWTAEEAAHESMALFSRDAKPVRIFKCEAEFDVSAEELFDVLYGQFETSSLWNVTTAQNKILKKLDDSTDLVHVVSAPALGGMITSRDFVNSRTWRKQGGDGYVVVSTCAGKNLVPTTKGATRGVNGPTGFVISPHEASPFKSRLVWVLNCDIKMYLPSSAIRKGSLSEMNCFVRNLRNHLSVTRASESGTVEPTA